MTLPLFLSPLTKTFLFILNWFICLTLNTYLSGLTLAYFHFTLILFLLSFFFFFFLLFTIVLSQWDSPLGNLGCFAGGKPAVTELHYPTHSAFWVFFSVSIIHWTLTWTTGSLTCAHMLMHMTAHRGVLTHVRESALKVDSRRKIPFSQQGIEPASAAWQSNAVPISYVPIPLLVLWIILLWSPPPPKFSPLDVGLVVFVLTVLFTLVLRTCVKTQFIILIILNTPHWVYTDTAVTVTSLCHHVQSTILGSRNVFGKYCSWPRSVFIFSHEHCHVAVAFPMNTVMRL